MYFLSIDTERQHKTTSSNKFVPKIKALFNRKCVSIVHFKTDFQYIWT